MIGDSRTLPSTPESGSGAGDDGHQRQRGGKTHMAVDTLGHLLALHVTAASEQDRSQVGELAMRVQEVKGEPVQVAFVPQRYTGEGAAQAAEGIALQVVRFSEAKKGFVLLLRRWSAVLAGCLVLGGWFGTTSVCPRRWLVFTWWRL